jgi:hypothetical protein
LYASLSQERTSSSISVSNRILKWWQDEHVVLTVRDKGHWIERGPDGPPRYRGNGLPLMEALMDSVELTHENGDGTAVRMARSLSPDRVVAGA